MPVNALFMTGLVVHTYKSRIKMVKTEWSVNGLRSMLGK